MLKLLLTAGMIAALCGMVICNRKPRKEIKYKIIALILLLLVLISGGLFMYLPALSEQTEVHKFTNSSITNSQERLTQAVTHVLAGNIKKNHSEKAKVLLIGKKSSENFSALLKNKLEENGISNFKFETINVILSDDSLILPVEEWTAEAGAIDDILERNSDCDVAVLTDINPAGESLRRLKFYKRPESKRPKFVIIGLENLNAWTRRMVEEGFFEALAVANSSPEVDDQSTQSLQELFAGYYVLIDAENLRRNLRFFNLDDK